MARVGEKLRAVIAVLACCGMAVVFGGWEMIACPDQPPEPVEASDSRAGSTHAKRNLTTQLKWVWANGTFAEFDVADQRSFTSWGYNRTTRSIPWIDKFGLGRCLVPVGSCSVIYGRYMTEVCDRDGPDTCLFRREAQHKVSFTYGVAFNRYLTSCVGTRINWDGSHVRNSWGDTCSSNSSSLLAAAQSERLTIGEGPHAIRVDRYLTRRQLRRFDVARISQDATRARCGRAVRALLKQLPAHIRRLARGDVPEAVTG